MEQLEELRQKILESVVPLIIDSADTGSDKFSLILRLIQSGNADQTMFDRAYKSASTIEDSGERLNALMALLDEVEIDLTRSEEEEDDSELETSEPEPPQEQAKHQDEQYHEEHHEEQHHDQ